ncbi:MAG: CHRD domain-containing protein [bacterium]
MRKGLYVIAALGAAALLALTGCENLARTFSATLNGSNSVPSNSSIATGDAQFNVDLSNTKMEYTVNVANLADINTARLHYAPANQVGDAIAVLYGGPRKAGSFSGQLTEGTLLTADLIGPMAGKSIKALVSAVRAGSTYVNIATDSFPNGEIRGQLR